MDITDCSNYQYETKRDNQTTLVTTDTTSGFYSQLCLLEGFNNWDLHHDTNGDQEIPTTIKSQKLRFTN